MGAAAVRGGTRASSRWPVGPGANPRISWILASVAVFVVAGAARVWVVQAGAGLGGNYGYDVGVYYAASDALIHGRLPYRDFVLLHPPGLMLVLTPFALLGRLTTDHLGFMAANLAFSLLGAVNATLVVLTSSRLGLGLRAAVAGGVFYAVWPGAVDAEFLARLEPLGNFFLLLGIYAFVCARGGTSRGWFLGGLAFGAATSVKVWWVIPLIAALVWVAAHTRDRRQVARAAIGAVASMVAINVVFFAADPRQMVDMVIIEQLGRPQAGIGPLSRLGDMASVTAFHFQPGTFVTAVAGALILIVIAGGLILTSTVSSCRPLAVLLAIQFALLLSAPSWFNFYADFVTPAAALCVAVATWRLFPPARPMPSTATSAPAARPLGRVLTSACASVAVAAALVASVSLAWGHIVSPFPAQPLRAAVADSRCVMSDSPMALIELNVLSRDLANGCQNWVDVTGRTYGVDHANTGRTLNQKWQGDLYDYLSSGETLITIRAATGINARTFKRLHAGGVVTRVGNYVVYRSPRSGK